MMDSPYIFDKLAKTVKAIIYVASPLSNEDFQNTVIAPTWAIDESILSLALQAPSVRRVIITGSIVPAMMIPEDPLAMLSYLRRASTASQIRSS
jgi:hypothetical protein